MFPGYYCHTTFTWFSGNVKISITHDLMLHGGWVVTYFFQGGIDDGGAASVRAIMHWQYRTICRGPNSILKNLYDEIGSKAHDYISFYGLRAHGRLGDGGPLVTNQVKFFFFCF